MICHFLARRPGVIARIAILIACVIAVPRVAEAKFEPPPLAGHLVDTSKLVRDYEKSSIDRRLDKFRKATGAAIVVFVTSSLQGEAIEDAAYTTFNTWKVGDAGKDNGVLIMIAPIERKVRIETGKGIGGAITDLQANDIIAKMGPAMKVFQLEQAIDVACSELEKLIIKEVPKQVAQGPTKTSNTVLYIILGSVLGLFALIGVLMLVSKRFREVGWPILKIIGFVFYGIIRIIGLFGGRGGGGGSDKYSGGGGTSGGGGSSGSY